MHFRKLLNLNLLLHSEEGAEVGGIGTTPANDSQATEAAEPVVMYGKPEGESEQNTIAASDQSSTATADNPEADANARAEAYKKFRDDNKDLYEADLKTHLGQRLKGKDKEIGSLKAVVDPLLAYFGYQDISEMAEFIKSDILPQVEGSEAYQKLLDGIEANEGAQQAVAEVHIDPADIASQAVELSAKLGSYDVELNLEAELANQDFYGMLQKGLTVEQAYNAIHHDELVLKASQRAAAAEKKAVIESIRTKGLNAVTEQATKPSPAVVYKTDPNSFSDKDFADIEARVMRGEKIRL